MKAKMLILILIAAVFSGNAIAQPKFDPNCKQNGPQYFGIPDLTEEQKTELQKMKTAHMKEVLPLKNALNEKQAHLKTISTGDNPDINAIYSEIDKIGQLKTEIQKKRAKHRQDIRQILTEDQRIIFDMHADKMHKQHRQEIQHGM